MFKPIIIGFLVMSLTLQACEKGCLKCNSKSECIFCDVSNAYYLSGTSCAISTLSNCLVFNSKGECAQCQQNCYLDISTKKCVAVETAKQVQNCAYYGAGQVCIKCVKGYFISNGQCSAVTKTIDNCDIYSDDGKCAVCASGYIFNAVRNGCIANPNAQNCAAYSFLDCKSCNLGYIANPNLYFVNYQANSATVFNDLITFLSGGYNDWISMNRCQKIQDTNCLVASAYNVCITCNTGFFLTADKTCRAYPKPIIEGCSIYSSLTTCSACQNGYFLESATKCTLIASDKMISDCSSYSTTAAIIQCVQCTSSKFLSGNACTPNNRTDSLNIANCKTTTVTADTCAVCNDGFTTTSDGKKCLAIIANCKVYTSGSSSSTTALTCQTCNDTYYLNTDNNSATTCVGGTIEGCLTYSSSSVCTACNTAAYYLSNSKCMKHVSVANCLTYSGINFNQCMSCASGYYPFTYSTTCSAITVISNCIVYTDANTCATCADGYFIQSNKCVSISATFPNCKSAVKDATSCSACIDGYALKNLNNDKTCAPNHNYLLDQCDTVGSNISFKNQSTIDTDSCLVCKENSFPVLMYNMFGCINNNLLATKGIVDGTVITGCLKYGNYNNNVVCMQCPVFLNIAASGVRTCVTTCDSSTNTHIADNLNGHYNTCAPYADTTFGLNNCGQAIRVYTNAAGLACVKSGAQSIAADFTTASADNASFWRDIDGSTVPRSDGAFLYYGVPTLLNSGNTDKHDNQSDTNKNCELYWIKGSNLLCARCRWGYSTKFVSAVSKTQCASIDGCDTTISYTGFSNKLNMILSCHACNNNKFLLVTAAIASDVASYVLADLVSDISILQCVTPTSTAGSVTATVPLSVNNCLIYGWLKVGTTDPTNAKGCLACKPGYTLSANFGSCTQITGCDLTKNYMANRCSVCTQTNANGATEWKAFKDYNADTCLSVNAENCLFASTTTDSSGKYYCQYCKPGFYMTYDSMCEKVTLPQCRDPGSSSFYLISTPTSVVKAANYYAFKFLSKATTISGCDTCATGFTGFRMLLNEIPCALSSYVQANNYVPSTPILYVTDCAKYNRDLTLANNPVATCAVCKNNKITTADGKSCVASIQNCKKAQNSPNSNKCQTCASTHVQVAGVCILKNIVNCANYDETVNVTDLLCTACADGFVLATNKKSCYAGNVIGCKIYSVDLPWVCTVCLTNYSLISTANSKTYCLKINDGSNCSVLDVTLANGLQGGFYKCSTCTANNSAAFYPKSYANSDNTLVQSVCLSLNLIDKCVSYGTNAATVGTNTFLCTACSNGFFVDETKNTCVARTVQLSACNTYYPNKDKCQVCNASSFKTNDETDCISFPNGILRCATYSNDTICTSCNTPAYLSNNTCPLSTVISNCASYIANYTCSACGNGYFLTNSTSCVQAQATNCLTYSAINACATCDSDKGLKTDTNGATNCVDKGLSNCEVSSNTFPFTCTQCKSGYYLAADATCTLPTMINKCVSYDSASTCTQCDKSAVLSVDRKTCNDTMFVGVNDANCADNQQVNTPFCSKCSPGAIFVNGTCSFCSTNTYTTGCFSCDPTNQTNCFACRPGFYQTANGACVSLINQNMTNVTNNTPNSALITKILSLFAFLAVLF